jgi:hemolysin III
VAIGLYAVALPTMFLCALLFGVAFDTPQRGFFRRLDHAAIFAMIAATATPFAVVEPAGGGLGFAVSIWVAAAIGIFVKLRYPIGRARGSAAIFGLSGWAVMLMLAPTISSRHGLLLILLGGALYTIGIGFHLWRRLRFHRAIWHLFVVFGATAHYLAVAAIVG